MPDWYAQIAVDIAYPYIEAWGQGLALFFILGFVPGIISMIFSGHKGRSK